MQRKQSTSILLMEEIKWNDFERIEMRAGTVVEVKEFPEARKPAWILKIDFGEGIGIKVSSAQIRELYRAEDLLAHCASRGVVIRGFPADPLLAGCLRISVGSEEDISALAAALEEWERTA